MEEKKAEKQVMKDAKKEEKQAEKQATKDSFHQQDAVQLKTADTEAALKWLVHIRPKGSKCLLSTPQGNVKCNKDGNFGNKGGEGIWAQWQKRDVDHGFFSFKHAGTEKYLAIDSSGKAVLSDTEVLFSLTPADVKQHSGSIPVQGAQNTLVKLAESDTACMADIVLPWAVDVLQKKDHILLKTPNGNVRCDGKGVFTNKGGDGKWARWTKSEVSNGFSLKNHGHGKYLSLDSAGKPGLSSSPVSFTFSEATPSIDNKACEEKPLANDVAQASASHS